jgi:AbrB family looped-hinge helix DNA binding protein
MTHRVGPKGQVVIPKELRDAMGLAPGDEVDFAYVDGDVVVRRVELDRPLRGRFAGSRLAESLVRERRADRRREDRH